MRRFGNFRPEVPETGQRGSSCFFGQMAGASEVSAGFPRRLKARPLGPPKLLPLGGIEFVHPTGSRRRAFYGLSVNRRQQKHKQARRFQHTQETRTPDRPRLISGSECPTVDNGHIVPRTYQRAWEGEGRQVAVHAVGSPACELQSTKIAGARGPYYRRTRPRHGTQTDNIEASLAHVESRR